jgi:EAL domain-containing protein (putative c-di-GMP-specific phosphodiesterase class I)/GGDEF domain-containing protein
MARSRLEFLATLRAGARRFSRQRGEPAATALAAAGDLAYAWNTLSDGLEWFGETATVFGRGQAAPARGRDWQALVNPQDLPARAKTVHDALVCGGSFTSTFRLRLPDGAFHWVSDKGAVEIDTHGAKRIRGVLRALDAQPEARPLTAAVPSDFAAAFAPQEDRPAGLVVAWALDHLDRITEAFGPAIALEVIETVQRRTGALLGPRVAIVSIGRGAFACALRGATAAALFDTVDALRCAVREETVETRHGHLHVTLSLGLVAFNGDTQDAAALLAHAESALTQARFGGRDRLVVASPAAEAATHSRTLLLRAEQVLTAIRAETAFFAYQPVVDRAGRPAFHECLLRLRAPDGGLVPAGVFIPAVEALGLHATVDGYVLARVLDELTRFPALHLSCNLSSLSFADPGFCTMLEESIAAASNAASRLILEITETAALPHEAGLIDLFRRLRAHGVKLALDDFGAGHTSLKNFTALPLDIVKLDGSLVRAMGETPNGAAVVRALIDLAGTFGFAVVAEGVEYGADAEALRRLGVDYLQGYHCGRPIVEPPWRAPASLPRAASVA